MLCSDIAKDRAEETAELVARLAALPVPRFATCKRRDDVQHTATIAETFFEGPPSLMVNNAGVSAGGRIVGEIGFEEWYWVLGVNLVGVVHGCEVFAPVLRTQRRAGIINVASAVAYSAAPWMAAYSASKAAVLSLSETLCAEMGCTGV